LELISPVAIAVIAEDEDLIVIDKPAGMAVHPSPGWEGPTVVQALADQGVLLSSTGASEREGVVHRLDANTTGVMVLAKSERAYLDLKDQFRERSTAKVYHALVQGHLNPTTGTIDAPIDRHPKHGERFAIVSTGRDSITHYRTLEAFRGASLLEVDLETGRTHQIRVHLSAVGHPCVGDTLYGADPKFAESLGIARQWLHASKLTFRHPATGESVTFETELPKDLAASLARLRADN
jgi:23S rRNA pseudouridine1911/1915/1917 synthase